VRADLTGPTGLTPFGHPLGWRGVLGYRHFLEEDLFDTRDFYEIGGGLELDLHEALPFGRVVSLNAALILGPAVIGWTAGVSLAF